MHYVSKFIIYVSIFNSALFYKQANAGKELLYKKPYFHCPLSKFLTN